MKTNLSENQIHLKANFKYNIISRPCTLISFCRNSKRSGNKSVGTVRFHFPFPVHWPGLLALWNHACNLNKRQYLFSIKIYNGTYYSGNEKSYNFHTSKRSFSSANSTEFRIAFKKSRYELQGKEMFLIS